jgi:mannosyltransferase OCH1-like enzyme
MRNIFLYWTGKEYTLITILRNLIKLHSTNGKGYQVILIDHNNIRNYIQDIPDCFNKLSPAHQADFVRVHVICDYGGIWLDSDTLVIHSLDCLFDIVENQDGFFIKQNNKGLWNGIFGSQKNTPLMVKWKKNMLKKLLNKKENIDWNDIGGKILKNIYSYHPTLYDNYHIFNGLDNLYPVNFDRCEKEFIEKPFENYKTIVRNFQPLVVLVNSLYKRLENMTEEEILNGKMPLNYFINKSFDNVNKKD